MGKTETHISWAGAGPQGEETAEGNGGIQPG